MARLHRTPLWDAWYRRKIEGKIAALGPVPRIVYLESTNACNAKCIFCPRDEMERKQGFMSEELSSRIFDQCADWGVPEIRLHNFGETTLDRKFVDRVRDAKKKGIPKVGLYTNASKLTPDLSEKLIEAGLDAVWISVDGVTKESYERIRVGLSFEELERNAFGLVEARRRLGAKHPFVTITMTYTPETAAEAPLLAERYGRAFDKVTAGPAHAWTYQHGSPEPVTRYACPYLWTALYILWDGRASICCEDFDGREILGDATRQTLREIWEGEPYRKARRIHHEGRFEELPICQACPVIANSFDRWLWWAP